MQKEKHFTHLHVHTQYSLLDGASKPAELLSYAKSLGMDSIAITDHGNMYGAVAFYQEAQKQGIKPIIGCECYLAPNGRKSRNDRDPRYHLILLAENNTGYKNLARLVSLGFIDGFYRKPRIDKDIMREYSEGIICLSACIQGEVPRLLLQGDFEGACRAVEEYIDIFGKDNYFLEMQNHGLPQEQEANKGLRKLAEKYGIGLVVTNDLHYVKKEDASAQDVLLCIQTNKTVDDPDRMRFNGPYYYCKSYDEMLALFPGDEEALENTWKIAQRCNVDFTFGELLLPEFPIPQEFEGADDYLRALCLKEIDKCYGRDFAERNEDGKKALLQEIHQRLDYELDIIKTMGYSCYFLIVWDFINYCRNHKDEFGNHDPIPVGPGRGSAAGSIVAYLLHITAIEPLKYDLLFERFLNPERVSMPDIDTDFCYKRRNEVLDYVIRKYGADHVGLIITFGTLQARAAVRDVGRALDVNLAKVDKVAKAIPREIGITLEKALKGNKDFKAMYDTDAEVKRMVDIAMSVEGLPRNSGTHAAGVVIAPKPLIELVPLQLDEASGDEGISGDRMITTQFDKEKVEELGLLKMDFLGLRTLTVMDDALRLVKEAEGISVDLENLPLEDEATVKMLREGDTQGVFQLESAGMTSLLMKLHPDGFKDLIPLVALYRPGPLGTGMADDFIEGRHGNKTAESLHPLLDPVLADTYGVILYQEQVMKTAAVLAGFSLGEADILRRAMGKKKVKVLESMKERFVEGAAKLHGVPKEKSGHIFELLEHFAGYGFNKSHSVAYALVAYQTAYIKAHWPAEYFAALISSVIADPDKMSWYINVCKERGMQVLPPDINASEKDFSVENGNIRFGLFGIKSVGSGLVDEIVKARRKGGKFTTILDFCKRVNYHSINKRAMENLINCGALDSLGVKRSQLNSVAAVALEVGQSQQKDRESGQISLFGEETFADYNDITLPNLPEMPKGLMLKNEKELVGYYVSGHPLDGYKKALASLTPLYKLSDKDEETADGSYVQAGGIISRCNIKLTKKGDTMAILTLEDFSGKMTVIVFPKTYSEFAAFIMEDGVIAVDGRFSVDERESKIIASNIVPLEEGKEAPGLRRRAQFGGRRQMYRNDLNTTYENNGNAAYGKGRSASGGNDTSMHKAGENAESFYDKTQISPDAVVHIRVPANMETPEVTRELMKIFKSYHGEHMVYMDLLGSRKRIRLNPEFYLAAENKKAIETLENLLGENSVHIVSNS